MDGCIYLNKWTKYIYIPQKRFFLRPALFFWGGYALVWIGLEGRVATVVGLALSTAAVTLLAFLNHVQGRQFFFGLWVVGATLAGAAAGAILVGLTLLLMAVKTGLHGHGPEFTPGEIRWVIDQLWLWSVSGGVFGLSFGLISAGLWGRL